MLHKEHLSHRRNLRELFGCQVICQWSTFTSSLCFQPLFNNSINTILRVLFCDVLWAETHYDNCFNVKPGASLVESSAAFNQLDPKHRNASKVEVSRWALFFNWLFSQSASLASPFLHAQLVCSCECLFLMPPSVYFRRSNLFCTFGLCQAHQNLFLVVRLRRVNLQKSWSWHHKLKSKNATLYSHYFTAQARLP